MPGFKIIYEDDDIYVTFKDAGLLTEATRRHEPFTLEGALNDRLRKGQSRSRRHVWLVHRLDRDTAGVMVVAKSEEASEALKGCWHEAVVKQYLAVVRGVPDPPSGVLKGCLYGDADLFVRQIPESAARAFTARHPGVALKYAETAYETLGAKRGMALLRLTLATGRRNQIRVQLADAGWPILGDAKYGAPSRGASAPLHLHAFRLSFPHPRTGERMTFEIPPDRGMFAAFDVPALCGARTAPERGRGNERGKPK